MAIIEATTMIYGLTRQCFTGDTLVATEEGNKAIKDIRVGDYVYSYDVESDARELKKVTAVFISEKDELYRLETSEGTTIDTTEGHPFYVEGKGWTVAAELKPEDILTTADGKKVTVESITIVKIETSVMVYNLEVEDNHTYYVSEDEVLVHNMCKVRKKSGKKSEAKRGSRTNTYDGVRQASEYLKQQGVPRQYRKQILESFDVRTIKLQTADDSTYGLRFYGGNANAEGRYLFETFSPLSNRNNLALPYEWNSMMGIQQFKVKNGTTMITGSAAPQTGFGSNYIGGIHQWYINNLEDLIKCQ